jgi:hypothetical protein
VLREELLKEDQFASEEDFWAKYQDHPICKKNRSVAAKGIARMTDPALPDVVCGTATC